MEIITGNKTCVPIVSESNAKKDAIAIVIGIKVISKMILVLGYGGMS